jgi:hypothetical protein
VLSRSAENESKGKIHRGYPLYGLLTSSPRCRKASARKDQKQVVRRAPDAVRRGELTDAPSRFKK